MSLNLRLVPDFNFLSHIRIDYQVAISRYSLLVVQTTHFLAGDFYHPFDSSSR